jgi:predicted nucleotidyltransferase
MRLSNRIIKILQQSILKSFGEIEVYLFGSRVDDKQIGGDIDLALDVNMTPEEQLTAIKKLDKITHN